MTRLTDGIEAVVLRTTRYGEADIIAQLHARDTGRRGVIAKGARRPKSRLGARLEPFLVVRLQLAEGRGELAVVRGVEVIEAHDALRSSWRAQQLGAAALDLVARLGVEHEPNDAMHHLLRRLLLQLDAAARAGRLEDERRGMSLVVGFELKLLHASGMAPLLDACVRCGDQRALTAFAAADGGMTCATCRAPADVSIDATTYDGAALLTRSSLADIDSRSDDELPALRAIRGVRGAIIDPLLLAHAGVRRR